MAKQERKEKLKTPPKRPTPKIIERDDGNRGRDLPGSEHNAWPHQRSTRHEVQGILFGALSIFVLVSLLSYHYYADNPISLPGEATTKNVAGIVGAVVAHLFFQYFGYIAYAFPALLALIALDRFQPMPQFLTGTNGIAVLIGVLSLCALAGLFFLGTIYAPGGILGAALATILKSYFKFFGSLVVIMTGLVIASLLLKKTLLPIASKSQGLIVQEESTPATPRIVRPTNTPEPAVKKPGRTFSERITDPFKKRSAPPAPPKSSPTKQEESPQPPGYHIPSTTLLNKPQGARTRTGLEQQLLKNSKILEDKLLDFGIEGVVVGVLPGPVITRYEFQPAPGIKVSRIVNLSDDLALAMKAVAVRIVAPVPGKDVVGIEVPNEAREMVYLRDILESKNFIEHPSKLALGMGKDIGGRPYVADLTKMPHLLIAGATGSGKSVCLNGLICSMLFHATPDEVRFIMIDPKMLELGVYDDIPHLLIPVVKDPQKASNALNWATEEMTRRYGILAQKGVRNIAQYNEAIMEFRQTQHPDATHPVDPADALLPYIVVIVDELADLMMVAAGVEKPIARLAQMARAVGIHLILATQRPSVDVITGVIKANFPARIAFRVSSKVDSRTILDANGAEVLLGDGDMLFLLPGTSNLTRLHGAYLSEKEIKRLTTALKKMGQPHYDQTVIEYSEAAEADADDDEQELYEKAVRLVVTSGEASISMLRRVLKIGHSRASRFIDLMEKNGIVGDFSGSQPREILITPDQLEERLRRPGGR